MKLKTVYIIEDLLIYLFVELSNGTRLLCYVMVMDKSGWKAFDIHGKLVDNGDNRNDIIERLDIIESKRYDAHIEKIRKQSVEDAPSRRYSWICPGFLKAPLSLSEWKTALKNRVDANAVGELDHAASCDAYNHYLRKVVAWSKSPGISYHKTEYDTLVVIMDRDVSMGESAEDIDFISIHYDGPFILIHELTSENYKLMCVGDCDTTIDKLMGKAHVVPVHPNNRVWHIRSLDAVKNYLCIRPLN